MFKNFTANAGKGNWAVGIGLGTRPGTLRDRNNVSNLPIIRNNTTLQRLHKNKKQKSSNNIRARLKEASINTIRPRRGTILKIINLLNNPIPVNRNIGHNIISLGRKVRKITTRVNTINGAKKVI